MSRIRSRPIITFFFQPGCNGSDSMMDWRGMRIVVNHKESPTNNTQDILPVTKRWPHLVYFLSWFGFCLLLLTAVALVSDELHGSMQNKHPATTAVRFDRGHRMYVIPEHHRMNGYPANHRIRERKEHLELRTGR